MVIQTDYRLVRIVVPDVINFSMNGIGKGVSNAVVTDFVFTRITVCCVSLRMAQDQRLLHLRVTIEG